MIGWMRSLEKRKEIRRVIIFLAFYRVIQRDNLGQQQTPTNTKLHQRCNRRYQTPIKDLRGCLAVHMTLNGLCWSLLVSDGVFYCLVLSGDVRRVSEEFPKGYMSPFYGRVFLGSFLLWQISSETGWLPSSEEGGMVARSQLPTKVVLEQF